MSASIPDPAQSRAKPRSPLREAMASPADEQRVSVRDALAMVAAADVVEVYIGWPHEPVRIATRNRFGGQPWAVASMEMRARVTSAVQPLVDAGWRLDGSPVGAMRWDTSHATHGQQYDGCWVRMRSRNA
jgi:hypothetical protein